MRPPRREGELQPPVRYARSRARRASCSTPSTRWCASSRPTATTSSTGPASTPIAAAPTRRSADEHKKPKVFLSVGHDEYWSGDAAHATSRTRATPASTSRSSAATRCTGRRGGNRAIDVARTPHRTLVTYKETLAGAKIDPAVDPMPTSRSGPAPGATRASARRHRRRPSGERADRHDLDGQLRHAPRSPFPPSMADLRFWRNTRVAPARCRATRHAGAPSTLGYEWDEELDNGVQPAGLVHLSSTTVAGVGEDHRLRRDGRPRARPRTA